MSSQPSLLATLAAQRLARSKANATARKEPSAAAKADPVAYAEEVFGLTVWPRQAEFLRAALNHARVTVTSGHKTGKTISLAVLAWWFTSDPVGRPGARVPMTSSSASQLKRAVWREITALWRRARARGYDLPEPALDPATGVRWDDGREVYGFSTRDAEKAAGVSGPWMLYLCDEASGILNTVFEALEGNRAGGAGIGVRMVLASNPTQQSGVFFDSHHSKRALWYPMQISSEDASKVDPPIPGLATADWVAEKRKDWGTDSPIYAVRVLGKFPGSAADAVVGVSMILAAVERWADAETVDTDPLVIGLDVARYGDDDTVAAPRRGKKAFTFRRFPHGDGPSTAAAFLSWLAGASLRRGREIVQVNVDANGIGAAVYDCLAGEGFTHDGVEYEPRAMVRAVAVNTGTAARDPEHFGNLRAELHFAGRDWIADGGALPDDAQLQTEALAPKYRMDPRGRLLVSLKDDLRAVLGRSPDAWDAFLLSLAPAPPVVAAQRPVMRRHGNTAGW